ncbi:MAG: PAS domain-containing protein [Kouleothrix sp.]|nr:PAS domain-containing protein [Kouleothrix sp.]
MLQQQPEPSRRAPDLPDDVARLAAEYSPEPLLQLDSAGVVRSANPAALAELRYEPHQLIGRALAELLDEGSHAKGAAMLEAAAQGPTEVFELNQRAGDGTIVLVGYRAVPLGGGGALLIGHLMATVIATTERLIALNRQLNALFAIASVASRSLVLADLLDEVLGLALAELDAQAGAVLLAAAPVALVQAGRGHQTAPAAMYLAAQRGFATAIAGRLPDPLALGAPTHDSLRRGEPFVVSGSAEEIGLAPDDFAAPVGPLLSLLAVPLRGEDQLLGWLYAVTDRYHTFGAGAIELVRSIGDLLGPPVENARLYGALLDISGQLGAVLDSIDSGVLLIDSDGIVRYANARLGALLEIDTGGWPGRPRENLLAGLIEPVEQPVALFGGELWATAGAQKVLRRFTDQVVGANGARLGAIEVYSDVTQAHEMDRLKDEFIAAAAHDLKTPVTAVKGYTQIALRLSRQTSQPRLIKQLEMINARSDDLTYLMDTLLDMSRIQAGRLHLDLERFVLGDLIERVIQHFDFDLQRKGRRLATDLPAERIEVVWDCPRIERVLINLIGNALKYSPGGGEVGVRLRRLAAADHDETIELAVTDHGIGIPPEEREQIFDRFYRVPQAAASGFKGSGLGLYICRSVVEAHGGRIWAAEALHGEPGTTIYTVLPRHTVAGRA